ncbi:hypothetical protein L210DRAFT_941401 [Boletus edulis BED1]|uniref:Uncharacterized protein n=1 Tax=Boletus edulis BED1 TaxID=1328754 RepID=A0AAD4BPB0_BOLED|nr:hypothetical protein L210DRAFT_941401 [Boletus edulis BED1]
MFGPRTISPLVAYLCGTDAQFETKTRIRPRRVSSSSVLGQMSVQVEVKATGYHLRELENFVCNVNHNCVVNMSVEETSLVGQDSSWKVWQSCGENHSGTSG